MRTEIKEILTDIKAAMRIQHPESILIALDKILDLPEVSGNQVLEDISISNIVLPIGNLLQEKDFSEDIYESLSDSEFAVFKAISSVIAARRFNENKDSVLIELFALDRRRDVRSALVAALSEIAEDDPTVYIGLIKNWMEAESNYLNDSAIKLIPVLIEYETEELLGLINTAAETDDPDLKKSIHESLVNIANKGFDTQIIEFLDEWKFEAGEKDWIALKTLSTSWAVKHEDKTMKIIEKIALSKGDDRKIINSIAALKRNGAENIDAHLKNWKNSSNIKLQNIVKSNSTHKEKD